MVVLEEPSIYPEHIQGIPRNYNFEVQKTLKIVEKLKAKKITLQFPDGLLCYAPLLIDTIQQYSQAECIILDDVVYGACCVDDQSIQSVSFRFIMATAVSSPSQKWIREYYTFS